MGRVGPRFPSSSSHLPSTKLGGTLGRPCGQPGCMLIPQGWAGATALSSLEEQGSEGSCDWGEGEPRAEGRGRMRRWERSRSPCPNRFPLSR